TSQSQLLSKAQERATPFPRQDTRMTATSHPAARAETPSLARVLTALVLFGVSFGFVEAAVVVYLRALYEPIHRERYPEADPHALFPILLPEDLDGDVKPLLAIELGREAATIVMLAAAALAAARNFHQWLAGLLIAFGVWDIFFYVSLKVLLDWPESL